MSEPKDLVVAITARSAAEAEIIRSVLDDAGIMAVVPDRNVPWPGVDLTPFDGEYKAVGCDVLVPAEDLDRARQVLAEAKASGMAGASEEGEPLPQPGSEDEEEEEEEEDEEEYDDDEDEEDDEEDEE
jgi:hypothetical protein